MTLNKERDNYIDIVKGVGILSVVVGHAFNTGNFYSDAAEITRRFVYLYHLPIFFFCAGCFYSFKKPTEYFLKLFRRYYLPFVAIEVLSIVLYPMWVTFRVYDPDTWGGYYSHLINVMIYKNDPGVFTGGMWFLPFLCVSLIIYYLSDLAGRKICKWNSTRSMNINTIRFIMSISSMIIGIVLILNKEFSKYNINVAMLMQPVIFMGEKMYKDFIKDRKYQLRAFRVAFVPLAISMLLFLSVTNSELELSKRIIPPHIQILIIPVAIVFCLSIAAFIESFRITARILIWFGKNSFYIMAFHFMVFKGIDAIVGIFYRVDEEILLLYPYSFQELRFIYIFLGMILPVCLAILVSKLKKEMKQKYEWVKFRYG